MIPLLDTPRLHLIAPDETCAAMYEAFYTDEMASAQYGGPLTPAAAWARLAHDVGVWHLCGFGVWAIRRKTEHDLVGVCGFWQGRGWPRELTWWLLPSARGQGIAAEASRAAIAHAYLHFGWSEVETYMKDDNQAARSLVLRLGGRRIRRHVFPDGLERDVYRLPAPTEMQIV